ncbi:hypothetical protein [Methylobacterium sp.]|uniref:hypothetical protein n=1 Tax=Methylobacterium sp. TaxID=409 RepID=UPI003B5AC3F0
MSGSVNPKRPPFSIIVIACLGLVPRYIKDFTVHPSNADEFACVDTLYWLVCTHQDCKSRFIPWYDLKTAGPADPRTRKSLSRRADCVEPVLPRLEVALQTAAPCRVGIVAILDKEPLLVLKITGQGSVTLKSPSGMFVGGCNLGIEALYDGIFANCRIWNGRSIATWRRGN